MMYLITKWFGTFLCDKSGVKNLIVFPKDEKKLADKLIQINDGKVLSEEKKLTKDVEVIVSEKRLQEIGSYKPEDDFFKKFVLKSEDYGFSVDLLQRAQLIVSKKKSQEKLDSPDLQIVQMIKTLDDFIQTSNLLMERLTSWSDFCPPDEKITSLKNVCETINSEINNIQNQIDKNMNIVAPNITSIVGALIGARLISYAGGLERLGMMPASTIQILGAEKALFRFKKQGGRPPKHGVIFQHQYINKANKSKRGKIARTLAGKISTAAKADAFTKRDISSDLKSDLEERIKEIRVLRNKL